MKLFDGIALNVADMRRFGPMVVTRHLARLKKSRLATIQVPNVGPLTLRAGDSDMQAVRQILVEGDYDFSGADEMSRRVRARYTSIVESGGTPIIVDAGANIGVASLALANQFPDARIVAIEPDPGNAALLRLNLAPLANCIAVEAALGAEKGFVALKPARYSWAVRTQRAASGVPVITVQDAFEASGGDTPLLVKIDIEGFEKELFARNTQWIAETYVVIVEPHDWLLPGEGSSFSFQQAMARHCFEIHIRGENLMYVHT